ncbi:MAG TPA: family 16 glycoside hydrolase [Cyclobacteriaceae bacterium]|nr:family 16 glycoside hydrolase [Cyclobacteriaceae bacterium]
MCIKNIRHPRSAYGVLVLMLLLAISSFAEQPVKRKLFQAGAATSNITPKIGSSVNGGFQDRTAMNIHDEMHARGLVLDDGETLLAMVVMDLCLVGREVMDKAKIKANKHTGIPVENMLMSATHTHSAGTAHGTGQSEPDPAYLEFLSERAADAVIRAYHNRRPAKIGWAVGHEPSQVFNRRWKMKPGTDLPNPFGGQDRVKMNPGVGNPDLLEPAGPVDPEVPVISVRDLEGNPIALLANYALHYVGGTGPGDISADYFGMFANRIGELLKVDKNGDMPPFVGIMSNGASGDINNIHWAGEKREAKPPYAQMTLVANTLAAEAYKTEQKIIYKDWVSLASLQQEIQLGVRRPTEEEVKRARNIVASAKDGLLKTSEEVYARETLFMKDYPEQVPVILQAFRIGDLAVTAIPAEVFAEIGLELKEKNPFSTSFTIGLANGYNGYLPTPEQHQLAGYETWRARSSYLETEASNKITATLFSLLDDLKAGHQDVFVLSEQERREGFENLFDGTNLDKWQGNTTDYVAEDGVLVIYPDRGGKGDLFTRKEYSDFIFRFEFQLTPGANNGLGIRAPLEGVAAFEGIELQIIDNTAEKYNNIKDYQRHGSVYGVIPAKTGYLKPVGEWNYQEVVVQGPNIKVILNGTVILDGNIEEASKNGTLDGQDHPGLKRKSGHIGFLGHGDVVRFRNMRVKDLSGK